MLPVARARAAARSRTSRMVEVMRGVFIARCNPLSGVARGEGRTWEGKNLSHLARPDLRRFERPAPSAVYSSRSGMARRRGAAAARVCMAYSRSQRVNPFPSLLLSNSKRE